MVPIADLRKIAELLEKEPYEIRRLTRPPWMFLVTAGHCATCPGRNSCSSPCPEVLLNLKETKSKKGRNTYPFHLTRQEIKIMRSSMENLSHREEIRKKLGLSPNAMRQAVKRLKIKAKQLNESMEESDRVFHGKG